jgi:hypothetical protein
MPGDTEELLTTLSSLAKGLLYKSETDEPYTIFFWKQSTQGQFSLIHLLEKLNVLRVTTRESLVPPSQQVSSLLDALARNEIQAEVWGFWQTQLIVGQMSQTEWLGIAPLSNSSTCSFGDRHYPQPLPPSPAAQALHETLEPLLSEQKLMINGDESESILWETASSKEEILERSLNGSNLVEVWNFQGFGEPALDQFLLESLEEVLTYVFKTDRFQIYTVGRTPSGDYLGVSTVAVWT